MKSHGAFYSAVFALFVVIGVVAGYLYFSRPDILSQVKVKDFTYSKLSDSSIKREFATSRPVATKVEYGTSTLYGVETTETEVASEHSVVISGLLPGKDHNFRVFMRSLSGKTFLSQNFLIKAN